MAPLVKVSNLVKRFGGIIAVNDVSFEIHKGETLGFIGPNGAGKSTVVNCLTGYLPATSGTIEMNGVDITRMKPHQRAHMGLARTYQIPRPFPELTALTSVLASSIAGKKRINQSFEDAMYDATHYLEFVGLFSKRNILARDLTFYELRMLELARALATTPQLLFIDEVMAGLNPGEAKNAIKMIRRAKEQFGVTVFWIEHVMAVLMEAADRIVAINYGSKLAEGTPDEVVNNDDVIEAYLGRGWREYA
ncbi:MAG TPA: ABC transporter ATP-binding protein [Syntrophaceae bacterium]|jgi:branched-chain amino acid transport system ATP-binding protein|nr:ABC transporter ATP-binding protein [Smithellaceae bacterium]HBJ75268.1 ABC transporter ATP-binding protein [Syntrophaceae bacterium]